MAMCHGSGVANLNALVAGMHRWDFVSEEVHSHPGFVGFMYDRTSTLALHGRSGLKQGVPPKKVLSLSVDGNTQYVGDELKTGNPGANAVYYREFSVGYSKR